MLCPLSYGRVLAISYDSAFSPHRVGTTGSVITFSAGAGMKTLLVGPRPTTRLFTLWAIGIFACLMAWTVAYAALPDALLRGVLPAAGAVPAHAGLAATAWRILLYNVLIAGGLIATANLFRIGWFPLGYVPALAHWVLFGLLLGSNSFDVSRGRVAPSLAHLIRTTGFIEISAYTFLASATIGLFMYRQQSWRSLRTVKVRSRRDLRLTWCDVVTTAVAVGLLFVGAYRESLSLLVGRT